MSAATRVIVIEDDPIMGESLEQRLRLEGFRALWAQTGGAGLAALQRERPDVVVCDIKLPDMSGEDLYRRAMPFLGGVPILFITAFGDIEQAVRLMRAGADDYVTKPFAIDRLIERIRALPLRAEAIVGAVTEFGRAEAMRAIEALLRRVADIDSTILLSGETGVGKEVAARFLHRISPRAAEPFVALNCATLPADLVESQIFGHEKGAFTGAHARQTGVAELAGTGILFLDEIGELPLPVQAKLLRLIQERSFQRLGAARPTDFQARLICATNADLPAMVAAGTFREDLYFRVNVIEMRIPPLRERREDIVPLGETFLDEFRRKFGRPAERFDASACAALVEHDWPGNVRELRNRLERAVALSQSPVLQAQDLFPERRLGPPADPEIRSLAEVRDEAERRHILSALDETGGQIARAALLLGISRTTLWEKMRRLGIERHGTGEE